MVDPFHVKGPDGIFRGLNEQFDSVQAVERKPYDAWLAIQNLWHERKMLRMALIMRDGGCHDDRCAVTQQKDPVSCTCGHDLSTRVLEKEFDILGWSRSKKETD